MEKNYKKTEEQHYDEKAQNRNKTKFNYSDYVLSGCTKFYSDQIYKRLEGDCRMTILDYGCGDGKKHFQFPNSQNHIIGIDISSKAVEIANTFVHNQSLNAEYLVMDCEKMTFQNDSFDVVLDFGTFSSLDMEQAINELCRVLKKDGMMICIETYGHNPFMNLKRQINVLMGKRTKWASQHIMTKQNWVGITSQFQNSKIHYFHFLVLFLPAFLKILPEKFGNKLRSVVEKIDSSILKIRFLQFLAFKTVVVMENPKKVKNDKIH